MRRCLALMVACGALPALAQDEADGGAEPVAPAALAAPPPAEVADAGTAPPAAPSLRDVLMGVDPVYAKSGLLAPAPGHLSLGIEGTGQYGCDRFSARPDRRPIQVVADDRSGLHNACYRLGHVAIHGEFGLGKKLGAFVTFLPFAISQLSGGPVSRTAAGVSDLTAGFRLQVFDDDFQGAMIVAVGVPIGRSSTTPPIGPGDFRADFMSYLSKTFESVPVLLAMGMGMRLRGWAEVNEVSTTTTVINYSEELRFEIRAGYAFQPGRAWLPAVLLALALDGRWALDPGVEDGLGILNSPTGTDMFLGLEVVARLAYGLRVTLKGGQMVAGHSVPILTYFGAGIGFAR